MVGVGDKHSGRQISLTLELGRLLLYPRMPPAMFLLDRAFHWDLRGASLRTGRTFSQGNKVCHTWHPHPWG